MLEYPLQIFGVEDKLLKLMAKGRDVKHGGNLEKKSRWILNTYFLEIIPKPVFGDQVDDAYLLKTWYWEERLKNSHIRICSDVS